MNIEPLDADGALVVFSGGQDSSTCLAWALDRFKTVETIGFHYGQVHAIELTVREIVRTGLCDISQTWAKRLGEDKIYDVGVIGQISQSTLTGSTETRLRNEDLPPTFVPGRNLVFLTLAAAHAYRRGLKHIVTGVCETDYSGYPDCRDDTIKALQIAINLGMDQRFVLHTPLMWISKAATWNMAEELGGQPLVRLIAEDTHTCYLGDRISKHPWGFGCGTCPACDLREKGWTQFQQLSHRLESDAG